MPEVIEQMRLERVEHILASGTGTLDFAVEGEESYYTWRGTEDADWTVEDVGRVENVEEDRILLEPEGDYFTCEITADGEEHNSGPVRCYCPS
jgi:hypothetical protein